MIRTRHQRTGVSVQVRAALTLFHVNAGGSVRVL